VSIDFLEITRIWGKRALSDRLLTSSYNGKITMTHIDAEILLTITLSLCVLVTIRSMYLRKLLIRERTKLVETFTALDCAAAELEKLRQTQQRFQNFKTNLNQAELATKIQQPRLELSRKNGELRTPERYQYIHSLAEKGINASDIASILTISNQEADQLVALANLSRN